MVEEQIYKLKKMLQELRAISGRHTELVSVYIPARHNLQDIINMLRQEYVLTENVKNKTVRNNVLSAIDKILQELKFYREVPKNGLILFSGNVSHDEGRTEIKSWVIEPPEEMKVKKYWCDQKFELEPLEELVEEKEIFGLIVMDTKEASIGLLKGKRIEVLRKLESIVPGKTSHGGQSAPRFARVREGLIHDFYKQIGENVKNLFQQHEGLKGIILGGPGPSKQEFYDGDFLPTDIKKQVLGIKNIGYTDETGLEELVQRSQDLLAEASVAKEKALVQKFLEELRKGSGLVTYGAKDVKNALELGAVETIIVSENQDKLVDEFKGLAGQYGTKLEIISLDTREGQQLSELGGIGAFLRWKI